MRPSHEELTVDLLDFVDQNYLNKMYCKITTFAFTLRRLCDKSMSYHFSYKMFYTETTTRCDK